MLTAGISYKSKEKYEFVWGLFWLGSNGGDEIMGVNISTMYSM